VPVVVSGVRGDAVRVHDLLNAARRRSSEHRMCIHRTLRYPTHTTHLGSDWWRSTKGYLGLHELG
jgi:hypothetical protein